MRITPFNTAGRLIIRRLLIFCRLEAGLVRPFEHTPTGELDQRYYRGFLGLRLRGRSQRRTQPRSWTVK